jgi:hypothetical protein
VRGGIKVKGIETYTATKVKRTEKDQQPVDDASHPRGMVGSARVLYDNRTLAPPSILLESYKRC